jgi:lipid II:glycine glycyltransferase (peptidoglycan interpeptide bridge formation enzyme)
VPTRIGYTFERCQQERGIDYAELTLDWQADPAIWNRFQYVHTYLHTVWLQVPSQKELLWKGLSKGCRGAIRKAESDGVEVEEVFDRTFFEIYLDMAEDVYSRYRRPPSFALEFYQALWDALRPCGTIRVLAARRKQEVVAAAIFLMHREVRRAYYMDGVSYLRHRQLYASNLIQWTMLQELLQSGYEAYDMVGADHAGIRRFKLSFGGLLRAHDYVYRARTPWARIAREGYRVTAPIGRFVKYYLAHGYKNSGKIPTRHGS